MLGKQARVSDFWDAYGGNPILRHHAYLPGTHLLMAPFHLASRAALGWFDPRAVTLLAWAAAALLAARVAGGGDRGLVAAAAVLVSPLVYWQQIFGANDVLPAALLLAAVLLRERGRGLAAAAALGLACATKHMAWPYAPFLLVAWSGARGWSDLFGRARATLLRAAGVAAAVFALAVLPVAALDFRAFWDDVVLYNAGLGGDRYPLGGTPGLGLANFVVYAGGVDSLRDPVPLGGAYLLLLPLGLWLLHAQMREGGPGFALLGGSAALLASVYVSRVAHANYLIVAAALAPAGLLMQRRRAADVVVAPLLMLALAVEVVEQELFRATWEQAAAFGLQRRATGLLAALWPDGYPGLTRDPLGLLIGATLAGLAAVYLWAGLLGAGERARRTLAGVAVVIAVAVPALAVSGLGRASGAVRAQDAWTAAVSPREPVIEAWSQSFRRDPPRPLDSDPRRGPAVGAVRGGLARLGRLDPRMLILLAAGVVVALLSRLVAPDLQPLVLGAALLTPAAAVGVVSGSPAMLAVAGLLGAGLLVRRSALGSGLVFATTTAVVPLAVFASPVVLGATGSWRGWLGVGLAVLAAAPALGAGGVEAGLGVSNVLLYRGEPGGGWRVVLAVAAGAAAVAFAWVARRFSASRWVVGALGLTAGLLVVPGASAHELAVPLALLAVAATRER
jgi:hypothetical protein